MKKGALLLASALAATTFAASAEGKSSFRGYTCKFKNLDATLVIWGNQNRPSMCRASYGRRYRGPVYGTLRCGWRVRFFDIHLTVYGRRGSVAATALCNGMADEASQNGNGAILVREK
jgi:hypothetical protein